MRTALAAALVAAVVSIAPVRVAAQSPVLRFQIVEADGFTETDPAIADVRDALRELFRFRGYRLAAEAVIRVNGGSFSQDVATTSGPTYRLTAEHVALIRGDGPQAGNVSINNLGLWIGEDQRVLQTSLTVPVGQTVVVGSARPSNSGPTLILVVRTTLK
jgi:hypothetical protein